MLKMENILKGNIYIILNSPINPNSMSGSDKIFIKVAENIVKKKLYKVTFIGCLDGISLVKNSSNEKRFNFYTFNNYKIGKFGIIPLYVLRIISSLKLIFYKIPKNSIVISGSDALTDSIPLLILLVKNRGKLKYFSSMFMRKTLSESSSVNDLLFKFSQEITILITRIFKIKIFCNQIDENYLNKKGININKIFVLPGGIEFQVFDSFKKYDACFVGRINKVKGIPRLLDVWESVVRKNSQLKLAMVCSGTDKEVEEVKNLISFKKLQNNIIFLGYLDNIEKMKIIASSKVLLLPSFYESFGMVVLESFSVKVPVVAYDLESLRFNFEDKILYSTDNRDFKKNIFKLLDNTDLRERFGILGYDFSKKYSWENITEKFLTSLV